MPPALKRFLQALGPLAVAVIVLLKALDAVDWTDSQTALVVAEAGAVIGLVSALLAHFWRGTKKEPVAVGAALTATVTATLALFTAFGWWDLDEEQTAAVLGVANAAIAAITALVARDSVTAAMTPN